MMPDVDLSKVLQWKSYFENIAAHDKDAKLIEDHYREARSFLEFYNWCKGIVSEYLGLMYPGIVGVFLFKIVPGRPEVDEWVWVIVGDLPPAYITCEDSPTPAAALDAYIGAMSNWVRAAENGASVATLIPVNVPATKENAQRLGSRLRFLDEKILSGYKDDLKRPSTH